MALPQLPTYAQYTMGISVRTHFYHTKDRLCQVAKAVFFVCQRL